MIGKKLIILLLIFVFQDIQAQNVYLDSTVTFIDPSVANVEAGDTIFLMAGQYDYLFFKNINGKKNAPVTITNYGGEVIINNNHYFGVSFNFCTHIHLTGREKYGIRILGVSNGAGIGISNLSNYFEIDHLEIANTRIAGIMCKTDPGCSFKATRDSFLMEDIHIHHNYIHHTGTEGMYIGSSSFLGKTVNCNGKDTLLMPHVIDGTHIHNNLVEYTGWDGIQLSSAVRDCRIYNNRIFYDSQAGHNFQMSGILNGGGSGCDCYNNLIAYGKGNGIEIFGTGGQKIYNNIIVEPGKTYKPSDPTMAKHGIYLGERAILPPDSAFHIFNNTIVRPRSDGIRFHISANSSSGNRVENNIIVDPGTWKYYTSLNTHYSSEYAYVFKVDTALDITISHNIFTQDMSYPMFLDTSKMNYRLLPGSPAIDAGNNLSADSIYFDHYNQNRPKGTNWDIGACEFDSSLIGTSGSIFKRNLKAYPDSSSNQIFIEKAIRNFDIYLFSLQPNQLIHKIRQKPGFKITKKALQQAN
ncbi:MAG: right-handed parallel beta-helix repeat-containing protein [Bacteroidales bacterium]